MVRAASARLAADYLVRSVVGESSAQEAMPELSAGLLLFRETAMGVEVLLVHPGGPFWARTDVGASRRLRPNNQKCSPLCGRRCRHSQLAKRADRDLKRGMIHEAVLSQFFPVAAAIRACIARVRCGTMPTIRSMSISSRDPWSVSWSVSPGRSRHPLCENRRRCPISRN
jgi:hypothetical protein